MEVKLIENKNGTTVGYQVIADTKKEHEILLQVRNLHFFEDPQSPMVYDSMEATDKYPELVKGVSFITLDHMKERDNEIAKKMSISVQTKQAVQNLKGLGLIQKSDTSFTLPDTELGDVELQIVKKVRPYSKKK